MQTVKTIFIILNFFRDILAGAADEILVTLKNEKVITKRRAEEPHVFGLLEPERLHKKTRAVSAPRR